MWGLRDQEKKFFSITQVRDRLPHLKAIVQYKGSVDKSIENLYDVSRTCNCVIHISYVLTCPYSVGVFYEPWRRHCNSNRAGEDQPAEA